VGCRYQYVDRSYREAEVRWEESNGQQGDHWQRR
jgi:cyclopropane-fatty-acyl-phospholipid synthase